MNLLGNVNLLPLLDYALYAIVLRRFSRVFLDLDEKLLNGHFMNGKQPDQASNCQISPPFLNPPILHARNFMVKGKILMARIPFLLAKLRELAPDSFQETG